MPFIIIVKYMINTFHNRSKTLFSISPSKTPRIIVFPNKIINIAEWNPPEAGAAQEE